MTEELRRLSTGNYFGYYKTYYVFVFRRPHGKWCCRIGKGGEWFFQQGYHATFLSNLKKVKSWYQFKINNV